MTDHELLAALYEQQGRILAHAGTTARRLDEVAASTNGLSRSVGAIEARFAALDQRCADHHRRTGLLEQWQNSKDDALEATGRHEIARIDDQLRAMDEARRRKLQWVAGIAATIIAGTVLAWATSVLAGCF